MYGTDTVNAQIYQNTCESKQGNSYYKKCSIRLNITSFDDFLDNVVCEQFIAQHDDLAEYELTRRASRKEVTGVAVKMKRVNGQSVVLERDISEVQKLYTDVGHDNESDTWIAPVVATALKHGLITNKRSTFEPERDVTRAEAFSMIMKSVCMIPIGDNLNANWQENVYEIAKKNGITIRD